jgi:hypothetical protein
MATERELLLRRGLLAFRHLAERLPQRHIEQVLAHARSDEELLLAALSLPEAFVALEERAAQVQAARARGVAMRARLVEEEGGLLSGEQAAARLGISRQAIDKRRRAGTLLAIPRPSRGFGYPAWQFPTDADTAANDEGGRLPGLAETLKALGKEPPLAKQRFFLSGNHRLGKARPLDRLREGRVDEVVRAARAFGEHGAA